MSSIAFVLVSAAASEYGALAAPAPKATAAPADQYFGSSKMSAIGIRNKIDALAKRYHARTIDDNDIVHDAKLSEEALYAWQHAYPRDPWMVGTLYHMEQLYQAVQSTNARSHATTLLRFIAQKYPASKQAHLSRLRLAQGFPALHAETATHATPNPYQEEADRSASPSPGPSPAASGVSSESPMPAASPVAAPVPSAS